MIGTIDISKIMIGTGETGRGRVIPDHERGIEEERERELEIDLSFKEDPLKYGECGVQYSQYPYDQATVYSRTPE